MKKIINNPIFLIVWIIIILLIIFLMIRFLINYNYVLKYGTENFSPDDLKALLIGNVSEGYVVYYNRGNIEFDNGNYENAVNEYKKALEKHPPKKKECQIRINLAFASLKMLNFGDIDTVEKRNQLIEELNKVKKILTEEGCAHEKDDKGHSRDAQTLKNDIDKFIEELKKDPASDPKPTNEGGDNRTPEEKLKDELEEIRKQSVKEKERLKELFATHDYNFDGKTW